ncbi:MAG: hypothetical protein B7C24_16210 [Bacteroidetes bacterium 4572_77]|nr:MAG: hypothetical protein B7C24_16210 [Bacteroidetes bacterium 4572_77]
MKQKTLISNDTNTEKLILEKYKITYVFKILIVALSLTIFMSCNKEDETTTTTTEEQIDVPTVTFVLTDTGQDAFYDGDGNEISSPNEGDDYYGQDAQFTGVSSSFQDNGDGTVTDLNTGLMWQ